VGIPVIASRRARSIVGVANGLYAMLAEAIRDLGKGSNRAGRTRAGCLFAAAFGRISLDSPRVRHCCRQADEPASISPLKELISERSPPELRYLETRWALLVSYGLTVRALQAFRPVDQELNASTVRRTALSERIADTRGSRRQMVPI
jgi:hypothetical protein